MKSTSIKSASLFLIIVVSCGCGSSEEYDTIELAGFQEEVANADDSAPESSVVAFFEGEQLRLADGWKDAQSCVVWQGVTECFRSDTDAAVVIAEIDAESVSPTMEAPTSKPNGRANKACNRSCLHLYEHNDFKGRHLTFCDRGFWQNLGTKYGFNDKLSSYKTGVRGVHLSKDVNGNGGWYPGDTSSCTSMSQMNSGWNDKVSAIYINK